MDATETTRLVAGSTGSLAHVPPLGDRLRIVQNTEMGEVSDSVFITAVLDRGLTRIRRDAWPSAERTVEGLGPALSLNPPKATRAVFGSTTNQSSASRLEVVGST